MKIDAFVAHAKWYVGTLPFDRGTIDRLHRWEAEWWNQARTAVKGAYWTMAIDASNTLIQCQADFESSACVGLVDRAMKRFSADTLTLFCSLLHEVEKERLALATEMSGADGAEEAAIWQTRINDIGPSTPFSRA